jgi:hypothetical protein
MRLTTSRYYTPSGRSIQAQGIDPDIVVEQAKIEMIKDNKLTSESSLRKHLKNADVILMQAEAKGYSPESIALINQTRARAGLSAAPLTLVNVPTPQRFADSLAMERRLEFAFENVRWFDLLRYKTTLPEITQDAVARIKSHYAFMYTSHYGRYQAPAPSLAVIQGYVTNNKLLLPIPQREIDNNSKIVIPQNPGY